MHSITSSLERKTNYHQQQGSTKHRWIHPRSVPFSVTVYLTISLLCFEQDNRSFPTTSLQNSPVPACRAGTEGQQACDFTSVILPCTVAELWEQDEEVSVVTGHAGDQHHSRSCSCLHHLLLRAAHTQSTLALGVQQASRSCSGQEGSPRQSPCPAHGSALPAPGAAAALSSSVRHPTSCQAPHTDTRVETEREQTPFHYLYYPDL